MKYILVIMTTTTLVNYGFAAESREKRDSEVLKEVTKRIILDKDKLPGIPDKKGNLCITKSVMVKETKFDRIKECRHILKNKCYLTYITDYHAVAQEKCENNYIKDCHIVYEPTSHTERVKKCYTPYKRECKEGNLGEEVCSLIHEDHCETRYEKYTIEQDMPSCRLDTFERCENKTIPLLNIPGPETRPSFAVKMICEKWPIQRCKMKTEEIEKVHPKVQCNKESKKICMPSNCKTVEGDQICSDEMETVLQNIPKEQCELHPQKTCQMESVLVPKLIPKKNCITVPKEVCFDTISNPKVIPRLVKKLWCYNPAEITDNIDYADDGDDGNDFGDDGNDYEDGRGDGSGGGNGDGDDGDGNDYEDGRGDGSGGGNGDNGDGTDYGDYRNDYGEGSGDGNGDNGDGADYGDYGNDNGDGSGDNGNDYEDGRGDGSGGGNGDNGDGADYGDGSGDGSVDSSGDGSVDSSGDGNGDNGDGADYGDYGDGSGDSSGDGNDIGNGSGDYEY